MPSNPTAHELDEKIAKAESKLRDLKRKRREKESRRARAIEANRKAKVEKLLANDPHFAALIDDYLHKTVQAPKAREQLGLSMPEKPTKKAAAKKAPRKQSAPSA